MKGLAFHVHHDILLEYCFDYEERVKFIKEYKRKSEQKLRLKLFQIIPKDKLPQKGLRACNKACEAYYKARETYNKAFKAYVKGWEAYEKANHKEIIKLHKELCPDCPWDGKTIFKEKK